MGTVFVGGSRSIGSLPQLVCELVDTIIASGDRVVIGDADGADAAAQRLLADRRYPHVTVYYVGSRCRNNLGRWPTIHVPWDNRQSAFANYQARDYQLALDATSGLMLWDLRSRGTRANIRNLVQMRKPVAVCRETDHTLHQIATMADIAVLIGQPDRAGPT